jgi:SAM-dependent methyltransferase
VVASNDEYLRTMASTFRAYARLARDALWTLDSLRYSGKRFHCPICEREFDRMKPFVGSYRLRGVEIDHYTENAICPRCHGDIRQRFIMAFIKLRTDLFSRRQRVLHFAPEMSLYKRLKSANLDYVTADIDPSRYVDAIYVDITDIRFEEEFDCVICIHVLEHIPDDRMAIREIYRVLKPGGHAILAIPTYGENTFEIPGLNYSGREAQYGNGDHLRLNGLDFSEKLKEAGFEVELVSYDEILGNYVDRSITSAHTDSDKYLFCCVKPS